MASNVVSHAPYKRYFTMKVTWKRKTAVRRSHTIGKTTQQGAKWLLFIRTNLQTFFFFLQSLTVSRKLLQTDVREQVFLLTTRALQVNKECGHLNRGLIKTKLQCMLLLLLQPNNPSPLGFQTEGREPQICESTAPQNYNENQVLRLKSNSISRFSCAWPFQRDSVQGLPQHTK